MLLTGLVFGTSSTSVLVVPVFGTLAQVDPGRAVAAARLGFVFTGGTWWLSPRHTTAGGWALGGSAPVDAALGAFTLARLPTGGVRLAVGLIALHSGLYALFGQESLVSNRCRRWPWCCRAGVVGCLSAWAGADGPLVLLALLGVPATLGVDAA